MNKRIVSILVLSAMFLASCGESTVNISDGKESVSSDLTADSAAAEPETLEGWVDGYPPPDFEEVGFNGEILSICAPNWSVYSMYYDAEELNGEGVNDAVYYRTLNTQDDLDVKVTLAMEWNDSETSRMVARSITAGDDAYHIVFTHPMFGVSDYATENLLYDLNRLPYLNFDAPWWDKDNIEYFTIGTETYYGLGDILISDPTVVLFNKDISLDYNLPNHYDIVREGKWTLDRFIEEVNMVSQDIDGDGVITEYDRVGYAGEFTEKLCAVPFACGIRISEENENGLSAVFWGEKFLEIFEKCYNLFHDKSHSQGYSRFSGSGQSFDKGLALLTMANLGDITGLRDNEMDFGILPMFKYDETQEEYACYGWSCFVCVPISIQNPEKVGAGLEKFAYESVPVTEAYSEDLIRGKSSRDAESLEMIDIIYDSIVVDIASSYLGLNGGFQKCFYFFHETISFGISNPASIYKSIEKAANKTMKKLYDSVIENQQENESRY